MDVEPSPAAAHFIEHPEEFRELKPEEQLAVIADLILYYAQMKTEALSAAGKSRTDQSVEAQRYHNIEKYYENMQTNLRRLLDLKATEVRRGIL